MKVYRIENAMGQGPYNNRVGGVFKWLDENTGVSNDRHPSPDEDEGMRRAWGYLYDMNETKKYSFGFSTVGKIHEWFSSTELMRLEKLGFNVVEYEVSRCDVVIGVKQLAFIRDFTKVLSRTRCFEFLLNTRLALTGRVA